MCKLPRRPGPGGRQCQKANVEHKACDGPPCPKGAPSFRDLQCLSYDRHASKKKGNMLTAVMNEGEVRSQVYIPVQHAYTQTGCSCVFMHVFASTDAALICYSSLHVFYNCLAVIHSPSEGC